MVPIYHSAHKQIRASADKQPDSSQVTIILEMKGVSQTCLPDSQLEDLEGNVDAQAKDIIVQGG